MSQSSANSPAQPGERAEFSLKDSYLYDRSSPGRWLRSHIFRYWHLVLYVSLGTVAFIGMRSLIPVEIGQAFEVINQGGGAESLARVALSIVALAIIQAVVNLTTAYSNETVAQRLERDAREELLISLLSKSQTFHDQQRVGDVMARATNDVKQLNLMVSPALNLIYQSLLSLVIPLVLIATIHWQLLAAPILFMVFAGGALKQYIIRLGPLTGQLRGQFGQLNALLNEILSNAKVVRNFVQTERELRSFGGVDARHRDIFVAQGDVQARYLPLLILGITTGLGFFHSLVLLQMGILNFGQVVSYVGVLSLLRFPTFISLFSFSLVQMGMASARRILELMNTDTEIDQNLAGYAEPMAGHIRFDRVSFRYQEKGPRVLTDISFEVKPGESVAIVGPTGSGKTTLIKLLQRLYDVSEGQITVDGVPLNRWNLEALRGQIGVIEQDTYLFSRSIADNIAFGRPAATRSEIVTAAETAQARDFIEDFARGFDTEVGTRGLTLSGGQKQRVAIARALLADPRVLALDDATSAVDSATEDRIRKAMQHLMTGRTSLMITHRLAQIRHADLILVMKKGQIIAQGTHDELIHTCSDYRDIFEVYGAILPPLVGESVLRPA